MALIITLPEADFSGQGLPSLMSFGAFPPSGLQGLYKMLSDGAKYFDSSVAAHNLTLNSNASSPPTFASGVLSFPDTTGAGQYSRLLTGASLGTSWTGIALVRPSSDRLQYLFRHDDGGGANCYMQNGVLSYQFNNGSNCVGSTGVQAASGVWHVLAFGADATGLKASKNGAVWSSTAFSGLGGAPSTVGSTMTLGTGASSPAQSLYSDFAFIGAWDRVLTNDELSAVYKAIKNLCRMNKPAIVLP